MQQNGFESGDESSLKALEKSKRGTQYLLHSVDMKELDEASSSGQEGERILQKMSSVHFQSFEKDKDDENQVIFSKTMEAPPMLTQQFKGDGSG